uniref:Uncharacterized protein n=1 Tax=Molossus molossus TaxID=27622 RepID=A0A7J8C8Q9_MOLMO|nr:hypothetical protein HJG59_009927 [Molossus molossus]
MKRAPGAYFKVSSGEWWAGGHGHQAETPTLGKPACWMSEGQTRALGQVCCGQCTLRDKCHASQAPDVRRGHLQSLQERAQRAWAAAGTGASPRLRRSEDPTPGSHSGGRPRAAIRSRLCPAVCDTDTSFLK